MISNRNIVIILIFSSVLMIDGFSHSCSCLLSPNFFQCLFNPCLKQTCTSFTPDCISNYCGSYYFSLFADNDSPQSNNLGPIKETSPSNSKDYGRYKKPLSTIEFSSVAPALCEYVTRKHWNFISISTPDYLIVTTVVNLNYVANAVAYIYDRINGKVYHYFTQSLLAIDIKENGKSSISGCTHFSRSSTEFLRHCYHLEANRYEITAKLPMNNTIPVELDLTINYSSNHDQSLVLLYPIEQDRPAYTHKTATLSAQGTMKIGNLIQENSLVGFSNVDWTLSYAKRVTRWKWVSLSTQARDLAINEYVTIGINLSDEVYNDKNNISMENAIWINGQVYTVDHRVNISSPSEQFQTSQPWQISTTENDPKINLTVQPKGSHQEHENVGLVVIDFVQIFGIFNGTIEILGRTYSIENSVGIVENHYAKW